MRPHCIRRPGLLSEPAGNVNHSELSVHSAVRFHVVLGGCFCVILGLNMVAVRQVGMVSGGFVVAVLVMLGGFMVMARSVLVVLRCLFVVLGCFVGHEGFLPCAGRFAARKDYRDAWSWDGLQRCELAVKRIRRRGEFFPAPGRPPR